MSAAANRLYVSACTLAFVWLFATLATDGQPALMATAAGVALALATLVALRARVIMSPARSNALAAIRHHDRRRSVVRLADPDAPGRPRPRAPGHPIAG